MATQKNRNLILAVALAITLGLVYWVNQLEQENNETLASAQPAARQSDPIQRPQQETLQSAKSSTSSLKWDLLIQRIANNRDLQPGYPENSHPSPNLNQNRDLFRSYQWIIPPKPKPVKPPPPPPPVAPTVPFSYFGKIENTPQGTQVLLTGNNKVYSVAIGQSIDSVWQLDSEDANTLRFTYLPLGLPQVLSKMAKPAPAETNPQETSETQGVQ